MRFYVTWDVWVVVNNKRNAKSAQSQMQAVKKPQKVNKAEGE